jgi:hypothetical protein
MSNMQVVAYLRANKKGEPQWSEDCVCQDPVYPSDPDGSDSKCVSMPVVRLADALAAIKAKLEQAAQLVEQMTLRQRTMRAAGDAKPVAPCEIADAIRRMGEEAGRGESAPPEQQKDACEVCHGLRGGVPGNENLIDGKRVCDYCHADMMRAAAQLERGMP